MSPITTRPTRSAARVRPWRNAQRPFFRAPCPCCGRRSKAMDAFLASPFGLLILTVLKTLAILVPLLIGVAYLTLAERKVLAAIQIRRGPNVVGPFGLYQPFADAIKMMMKETIIPTGANRVLFLMA